MTSVLRTSAIVDIERDIDDVFGYLIALDNMDDWVTGIADTQLRSGIPGEHGARYECLYTSNGRTSPMVVEVTTVDAPVQIAFEARDGPFPLTSEILLETVGDETRVTHSIEAGADGRFTTVMFTLLGPILQRLMARNLQKDLAELKRLLEGFDIDIQDQPRRDPKSPTSA